MPPSQAHDTLKADLLAAAGAALPSVAATVEDDIAKAPCGGPVGTDRSKVASSVSVTTGDPATTSTPEQMLEAAIAYLTDHGYSAGEIEHPTPKALLATARKDGFVVEVSSGAGFKGIRLSGDTACLDNPDA